MDNQNFNESTYSYEAPKTQTTMPRRPAKVKKCASGRDIVFVFICLAVSIFFADFLFWAGAGIGVSIMAAAILAVSIAYLSRKGMKMSPYTAILSVLYVAVSASLTFSDGGFSKFLALCHLAVIYGIIIVDIMDLRRFSAGTYASIGDVFYSLFGLTFGSVGKALCAVFHKRTAN